MRCFLLLVTALSVAAIGAARGEETQSKKQLITKGPISLNYAGGDLWNAGMDISAEPCLGENYNASLKANGVKDGNEARKQWKLPLQEIEKLLQKISERCSKKD